MEKELKVTANTSTKETEVLDRVEETEVKAVKEEKEVEAVKEEKADTSKLSKEKTLEVNSEPKTEDSVIEEKVAEETKDVPKKATPKKKATKVKASAKKKETVKKETASKETTKKASTSKMKVSTYIQYLGREIEEAELIERVKEDWTAQGNDAKSIKNLELYVKPEEGAVYYVVNGIPNSGKVDF